jgi:hypothetical protein
MVNEKDYMPTETGLAQGARGGQVERLQDYLRRYGYIESPVLESFGMETVPGMAAPAPEERGVFDENTVEALRLFQEFNQLPVSGQLDEATVARIGQPRCGIPDLAEFANTGRRWPTTNLTYAFQEFTPDLNQNQIIQAIEQAFALWSAETALTFSRVVLSPATDIIIRFVADDHGDGNPFDGGGGVLAHAFFPPAPPNPPQPLQGDTHFDEAETWSITIPPPSGTFDLVTVAAHEFGHALGLGHSSVAGALMAPVYAGPHRFLSPDDRAGILDIYGGYPIANASWIHGTSVQVELPNQLESSQRFGSFSRVVGNANTFNWFHFAIPTPAIVNDDRKVVGPVLLRFITGGTNAVVQHVHIYQGSSLIAVHNDVNLSGSQLSVRFGVSRFQTAVLGLGISVGVRFGGGTATERRVDFISAGCDFRP